MEHIDIPKEVIEYFRALDREQQGIFWISDSTIRSFSELANISNNPNTVIGFFSEDADGLIHNHLHDSPFSEEDKEYMLPEYVYVLVTPSEVFAMFNGDYIQCDS